MQAIITMVVFCLLSDIWRMQYEHRAILDRASRRAWDQTEAFRAVEAWSDEVRRGSEGAEDALRAALQALKNTL